MNKTTDIIQTFGYNVKHYRLEQNISQEELSFRCDLHKNYISDIECCKRNISLLSVAKIAKGLKVQPQKLFIKRICKPGTSDY